MRFEEANELFGTETLQTMTMAQVNGGTGPANVWRYVLEIILDGVPAVMALTSWAQENWKEGDPEPTPDEAWMEGIEGLKKEATGEWKFNGMPVDSMAFIWTNKSYSVYIGGPTNQ